MFSILILKLVQVKYLSVSEVSKFFRVNYLSQFNAHVLQEVRQRLRRLALKPSNFC